MCTVRMSLDNGAYNVVAEATSSLSPSLLREDGGGSDTREFPFYSDVCMAAAQPSGHLSQKGGTMDLKARI